MDSVFWWCNLLLAVAVVYVAWRLFAPAPAGTTTLPLSSRVLILVIIGMVWGLNWLPRPKQHVIDRFHQLYYDTPSTWRQTTWLNVPTLQNPNDVWVHQEIISELKPDLILECGTAAGGSAIIWAMIQDQVNPRGRVLTIDVGDQQVKKEGAINVPIFRDKVDMLVGSSTDPKTIAEVKKRAEGKRVLVILDSLHKKEHVLNELRAYSSLVPVGGYIIVQDTDINGHPVYPAYGPGPYEAVEEFLKENDNFVSDPGREKLLFTMHPRGYLKRVK